MRTFYVVVLMTTVLVSSYANANSGIHSLSSRPGVTQSIFLLEARKPQAVVILFAGGKGNIGLASPDGMMLRGNFLLRSRQYFARRGMTAVLFDAPSDRQGNTGMLGFRNSKKHAQDVAAVIGFLRKRYPGLPVWLVGTSRGSSSVANAAIRIKGQAADGIVLTSSVTVENRKGANLFSMALKKITLPVLIVHHKDDACSVTPYRDARILLRRLRQSPSKSLLTITGGDFGGNPCKGHSHHGFLGQESMVVHKIADWIKQHH